MQRVLIAGGQHAFVLDTVTPNLKTLGIAVEWHRAWDVKALGAVPKACEGILVLSDIVNHPLSNAAAKYAKERGLPFAYITRKLVETRSALPEVAGNAAILVDPERDEELAEALRLLASNNDVRKQYTNLGKAQAARFEWADSVRQTRNVYRELL